MPAGRRRFRFPAVLLAELKLALKGQRWWWYLCAAGLFIAALGNLLWLLSLRDRR